MTVNYQAIVGELRDIYNDPIVWLLISAGAGISLSTGSCLGGAVGLCLASGWYLWRTSSNASKSGVDEDG